MIFQNAVIGRLQYLLKVPPAVSSLSAEAVYSRARENLADTVAPYRWSEEQLAEFVGGGVAELKTLRSDVARLDDVPSAFESALANYAVYRALALDNDAQNNNGALSDKYYGLFVSQLNAVPFFFTKDQLAQYADEAVLDIASKRTDLRITADGSLKEHIKLDADVENICYDLPERYTDAIAFCAAGRAAFHSKNDSANYFFEQYNAMLRTV